jgi:hypothetical protein
VIGKVKKGGKSFKKLVKYLLEGPRDNPQPDRVDWVESRTLPTDDPEAAARIMAANARDSERIQKPVYHFSISFDPGDPVNRAAMRQVADRTIRDLGLEEYQVLIIAHRDRAHPHLHFVVNRVHPHHHRAWSNSWDYARIERSLREQERELGLRVVPGKHAPVPGAPKVQRAPARLVRGDMAFVARVQREAGAHLRGARTWADLERALAEHGLSVRAEGPGFVVTDGVHKVKASEIDPGASRSKLERRLGALGEYRARQAVAARTLDERPAPRPPAAPARVPTTPAPAVAPEPRRTAEPVRIPPAKVEHRRIAASYRAAMERLFLDPREARARFRDALMQGGREASTKALRERPESFGKVRPAAAPLPDRAQDAGREAFRWSGRLEASGRADALRVAGALTAPQTTRADEVKRLADAGKRLHAWERAGRSLAAKLRPMLPPRAAGLVRTAASLGRAALTAAEPDHDRARDRTPDRGMSL